MCDYYNQQVNNERLNRMMIHYGNTIQLKTKKRYTITNEIIYQTTTLLQKGVFQIQMRGRRDVACR